MKDHMVSWEQAEDLGFVGEPWLSPSDSESLVDLAPISQIGTEELIVFGGARRYRSRLMQYPEGYHALKIVDMETGADAPPGADARYVGVDSRGTYAQMEAIVQQNRPLPTGDGQIICGAIIRAMGNVETEVESGDQTGRMRLTINPEEESVELYASGKLDTPYTSRATFETHLTEGNSLSRLLIWGGPLNTIWLTMGSDGKANKVTTHANDEVRAEGESLLGRIGIEAPSDRPVHDIKDPALIAAISNRVAQEFLGLPEWQDLNISATTSGLYAATRDTGGYFPLDALRFDAPASRR